MIPDRDDHLLDAAIRRALRPEPIEFDPNAWKSNHPEEVGLLDSWKTTHPGAPGTADAHGFLRRHAMKLSLAAAATIVLAVLSAIPFNGKPAAGVAWADMAQQLRSARTARVQRIITPDPASEKGVSEDTFLWKAPDLSRTDSVKPRKFTTICNGKNKLTLDPQKKTYAMESTQAFEGSMDWLLALAAVPPAPRDGTTTSPEVTIEDTKVALVPELIQQRDGRKLRKYRMMLPDNHGAPGEVKYAWFEVKTGKLAMFTSEMPVAGKLREIAVVKVELDIDLPYYLFSLKPPAGYQKAAARSMSSPGSIPTVSAAGRPAAFNSYLEARDQLNRYTLVVWSKR